VKQAGHLQERTDLASSSERRSGLEDACAERITRSCLLLNGQVVSDGDQLAIRVMDTWVVGEVRQDHSGWYLLTTARVSIRLWGGLTALWERNDERRRDVRTRYE
jgi:hypothetical protein